MELTARERDVTMMALMLYATSEPKTPRPSPTERQRNREGQLVGNSQRETELADCAVAREAYYKLLCSQAGVR